MSPTNFAAEPFDKEEENFDQTAINEENIPVTNEDSSTDNPRHINCESKSNYINVFPSYLQNPSSDNTFYPERPEEAELIPNTPAQQPRNLPNPRQDPRSYVPPQGGNVPFYPNFIPGYYPNHQLPGQYPYFIPNQPQPRYIPNFYPQVQPPIQRRPTYVPAMNVTPTDGPRTFTPNKPNFTPNRPNFTPNRPNFTPNRPNFTPNPNRPTVTPNIITRNPAPMNPQPRPNFIPERPVAKNPQPPVNCICYPADPMPEENPSNIPTPRPPQQTPIFTPSSTPIPVPFSPPNSFYDESSDNIPQNQPPSNNFPNVFQPRVPEYPQYPKTHVPLPPGFIPVSSSIVKKDNQNEDSTLREDENEETNAKDLETFVIPLNKSTDNEKFSSNASPCETFNQQQQQKQRLFPVSTQIPPLFKTDSPNIQ